MKNGEFFERSIQVIEREIFSSEARKKHKLYLPQKSEIFGKFGEIILSKKISPLCQN